jgi:hypothetical protein
MFELSWHPLMLVHDVVVEIAGTLGDILGIFG